MPELTQARLTGLLDAYLKAHYRWQQSTEWGVFHIGATAPEVEAAFPQAARFALLSAWNPHSVVRQDDLNRREDAALRQQIDASGCASRPSFASAPDRSWREPGWLIANITVTALDALSLQYGQLGTLFWERGEPVRLRMNAAKPAQAPAIACVDWLK